LVYNLGLIGGPLGMKHRALGTVMALCALVCVVGFIFDYIILGHGGGVSSKVNSFMGGLLSGSLITNAWYLLRQRA
jgi:hypothetical protein